MKKCVDRRRGVDKNESNKQLSIQDKKNLNDDDDEHATRLKAQGKGTSCVKSIEIPKPESSASETATH